MLLLYIYIFFFLCLSSFFFVPYSVIFYCIQNRMLLSDNVHGHRHMIMIIGGQCCLNSRILSQSNSSGEKEQLLMCIKKHSLILRRASKGIKYKGFFFFLKGREI